MKHWTTTFSGALLVALFLLFTSSAQAGNAAQVAGGCPPSHSPYLVQDDSVLPAAISYCAQGDADTGRITLSLPAGALRSHTLVVSGYLDGVHVQASIHGPQDEAPITVIQQPGEHWMPVQAAVPAHWHGSDLSVELEDAGGQHAQWGGIGLIPRPFIPSWTHVPAILLVSGLALLALIVSILSRRSGMTPGRLPPMARRLLVGVLAATVFIVTGNMYRNDAADVWTHPDASIPIKVVQAMHAHGDLNTDFARADIPAYFHEYRYNFSGYILLSYLAIRTFDPAAFDSEGTVRDRLLDISRWSAAGTLVLCLLLLTRHAGIGYGLLGTAAIAFIPQFYQDAHYVRLESPSALLFTLCFALATLQPVRPGRRLMLYAGIGAVAGLLTTIKFTYAICTLFCVAAAMPSIMAGSSWPQRLRLLAIAGGVSLAGFALGFCAGAPAIVADFHGYLAGIEALNRQYGGGHPPHGFIEPGAIKQFALISSYYIATLGIPLILLHIPGHAGRKLAPAKYAYAAILGITFLVFVLQSTFFERNFSPFLPVFVLLSTLGAANIAGWIRARGTLQPAWRSVAAAAVPAVLALSLLAPVSVSGTLSGHFDPDQRAAKAAASDAARNAALRAIGGDGIEEIGYPQVFAGEYPVPGDSCTLYAGVSYNDEWSDRYYAGLPSSFHILQRLPSDFDDIPISTLQPYHSATYYLFHAPSACQGMSRRAVEQAP